MSGKHSNSAKMVPVLSAALALLVAGAWQGSAFGQTVAIWDGGTGVWSDAANWNCDCVPNGFGYDANIGNTAYGNVTLNLSVELAGLSLGNGAFGELQVVNGNSLTASNAVLVGASSAGELSIANRGAVNDADGELGALAGSSGTATVSGRGSQWNNSGNLFVGYYGQGALTVNAGGTLTSNDGYIGEGSGGSGTVLLTGNGSKWTDTTGITIGDLGTGSLTVENSAMVSDSGNLTVGTVGRGTLTISSGGVVDSNGAFLGQATGSSGNVEVGGAGSQWSDANGIVIGFEGRGTLTVTDGGAVVTRGGFDIGEQGGQGTLTISGGGLVTDFHGSAIGGFVSGSRGQVIVSGAGSRWDDGLETNLDNGTLTIQNGGVLNSAVGVLGFNPGVAGQAIVTGTGSIWNVSSFLIVGDNGHETLTVQNGGVVNSEDGTVGSLAGSVGTALVTGIGSAWNNATELDIGVIGNGGYGTLTVQNGGLVAAGTVNNPGKIDIGTHGTVDAKGGTLIGNVFNDGTFDPLGTATVDGGFTLNPDGTLSLDVAGTGVDQYGVLAVSDFGTFDGTLGIDFINGFAPLQGDVFDFINDPGGASFNWAGIDILGLQPGFEYNTNFTDGQFTLTALNNGVSSSPEPGTLLLLGTSLIALGLCRRRRGNRLTSHGSSE